MAMTTKGRLYGISLGPGDPGLITRRAWELLNGDALWTYPVRKPGGDSFALDIVQRAGLAVPKSAIALCFPMTHDAEILAKHWLMAAQTILAHLEGGREVSFLVEGDASTYSTFGHLARTVTALDPEIRLEVVAGVTSYQAAAAHLGVPLADADDTLAILPAGYGIHTIDHLLDEFDSLVLLKVKPLLGDIIDLLERRGLLPHARFVEKVGCPEERTIRDLTQIRGETVNYLSLLLVHNPDRPRGDLTRGCRKRTPRDGAAQ
jgi:precorrin-2/cobalt-factor-2 C20-methyltransferase